jgi:hypothetical protein
MYGTGSFGGGIVALLVLIVVFLLCREIVCWYWKLNKIVANQEDQAAILQAILKEMQELNKAQGAAVAAQAAPEGQPETR